MTTIDLAGRRLRITGAPRAIWSMADDPFEGDVAIVRYNPHLTTYQWGRGRVHTTHNPGQQPPAQALRATDLRTSHQVLLALMRLDAPGLLALRLSGAARRSFAQFVEQARRRNTPLAALRVHLHHDSAAQPPLTLTRTGWLSARQWDCVCALREHPAVADLLGLAGSWQLPDLRSATFSWA